MGSNKHLKWIGLIFAGLLLMTTAFFWQQRGSPLVEIRGTDIADLPFALRVHAGDSFKLRPADSGESRRKLLREYIYTYDLYHKNRLKGEVGLTVQHFPDGDLLVFLQARGGEEAGEMLREMEILLQVQPPGHSKSLAYGEGRYNFTYSYWETRSIVHGDSPTLLPAELTLLQGEEIGICLGTAEMAEDLGRGVYKEMARLPFVMEQKSQAGSGRQETHIKVSIPSFGQDEEFRTWFYISRGHLLDTANKEQLDLMRRADLNRFRKFYADGIYDMVPVSYEPSHSKGFWRCPAQHVGRVFMNSSPEGFFQNIAASTVYTTISAQNDAGFWPTTPRSLWLYNDYGIVEGFYDTRFSTDAAVFLLEAYHHFQETGALFAAGHYADFLTGFAREHSQITANGGYLPMDYMGPDGEAHNHSSLNHVLAEMNFLYRMYLATGKEEYRHLADKMMLGVKDTRDRWIKSDGDLWYCRFADGSYGLQDYPTLTLKDLRESQQILTRVYGEADPDLARLIRSKEAYNTRNGLPLW